MIMFWVAVLALSILLYILLDGFDPCHELSHNVFGSPSKLPTCSFRDDNARDHDRRVALAGLLVNWRRRPSRPRILQSCC